VIALTGAAATSTVVGSTVGLMGLEGGILFGSAIDAFVLNPCR